MTDTPAQDPTDDAPQATHGGDGEPCKPMNLDFPRIAATVTTKYEARSNPRTLRTVEHALAHLREETGLGDKQIARVLLTAACLLGDLVTKAGPGWNGIVTTNWLSSCGARLWEDDEADA